MRYSCSFLQLCKEISRSTHPYAFVFTQLSDLNSFLIQRANHRQTQYLSQNQRNQKLLAEQRDSGTGSSGPEAPLPGAESRIQEGPDLSSGQRVAHGSEEGPTEDTLNLQLDERLRALDIHIGSVLKSLPDNSLLIVATGCGDTAECRRQQEVKFKRQGRVDGLPAWTLKDEDDYVELLNREIQGLCFCHIKKSA